MSSAAQAALKHAQAATVANATSQVTWLSHHIHAPAECRLCDWQARACRGLHAVFAARPDVMPIFNDTLQCEDRCGSDKLLLSAYRSAGRTLASHHLRAAFPQDTGTCSRAPVLPLALLACACSAVHSSDSIRHVHAAGAQGACGWRLLWRSKRWPEGIREAAPTRRGREGIREAMSAIGAKLGDAALLAMAGEAWMMLSPWGYYKVRCLI